MYRIHYCKNVCLWLAAASVFIGLNSCKKSDDDAAKLKWIQFRLISNDPNIRSVGVTAEAIHSDSIHYTMQYNLFQNLNTHDTFVMRLGAYPGMDLLNARFSTTLRIQHNNKVYSPVLAASGVYIAGDPYLIGWHYSRQWTLTAPQTVHSASDTIFYIRLQADTLKYTEDLF
jgi:hypothetical protein